MKKILVLSLLLVLLTGCSNEQVNSVDNVPSTTTHVQRNDEIEADDHSSPTEEPKAEPDDVVDAKTTTVTTTKTTTTKPVQETTVVKTTTTSCNVKFNNKCYKVGDIVTVTFGISTDNTDVATVGPIVLDVLKKDATDDVTAKSIELKYNLVVKDLSLYKVSDANSDPTNGYGSKGYMIRLADEPYTQGLDTKPKNYSKGQTLLSYTIKFKESGEYKYRFNDNIDVRDSENGRVTFKKIINVK